MSKSDVLAALFGVVSVGVGALMTTLKRIWIRRTGFGLISAGVLGIVIWVAHYGVAESQTPAGHGGAAGNTGNCNNYGPNYGTQNNCTTVINPKPPMRPDQIYQGDRVVAMTAPPNIDEKNRKAFFPTIWDAGALNAMEPIFYGKYVMRITSIRMNERTLMGIAPNGQAGNNIIPGMECEIIDVR